MAIEESRDAALDRLRREFVHRASRAAVGSFLDEYLADALSQQLSGLLPRFDSTLEAALHDCLLLLFEASRYWKRSAFDFTFNRQSFNALWETPRQSAEVVLPAEYGALPRSVTGNPNLTAQDRSRLALLLSWAREALPDAAMRAYAAETRAGRPETAGLKVTQDYVSSRWREFTVSMADRWGPAGQVVEKQLFDWMRVAAFTLKLVTGVYDNRVSLDAALQTLEIGWSFDRQVSVDRNIMRMAAFELLYLRNIPVSATINEAVELAKKYSTAESGRFVNGVLGAIVSSSAFALRPDTEQAADSGLVDESPDYEVEMEDVPAEEELAPA